MEIFISHSSDNTDYGNALVDLLTSIGVRSEDIIFTSNDAYGIPIGKDIFDWLKSKIKEKPFVIYLLSPEYYRSAACLNEMGAAWIVENDHAMIFTPDFDIDCYEFKNGAINPREIGFLINNENRLISFISDMSEKFGITSNWALINQKIKIFLNEIQNRQIAINQTDSLSIDKTNSTKSREKIIKANSDNNNGLKSRFCQDLYDNKLKDEEILLAKYIIDTDRFNLGAGWQTSNEVDYIKTWEDVNGLNNMLSQNYEAVIKRLEMKKLIEVSDITSHGNPKAMKPIEDFINDILDPIERLKNKINVVLENNRLEIDDLPF